MPRKAKKLDHVQSPTELCENSPQPTLTTPQGSAQQPAPGGRGTNGKFVAGNRGGPGNPHARHCARMLALFRSSISEQEMVLLIRTLYSKAIQGDVSALKILLSYMVGKPLPAPDPDSIDRDEWDHFQQDAIAPEEMHAVLGSLPTSVGNVIARTALPIMTDSRTRDLAAQLTKGCPAPDAEPTVAVDESASQGSSKVVAAVGEPLPNGTRQCARNVRPAKIRAATSKLTTRTGKGPAAATIGRKGMVKSRISRNVAGSPKREAPLPNGKRAKGDRSKESPFPRPRSRTRQLV